MTETVTIPFVDPNAGESVARVRPVEGGIGITLSNSAIPGAEVALPAADAARFVSAILLALGEKAEPHRPALPQSRQIGGIIGPY
jgi:hypothetical protein